MPTHSLSYINASLKGQLVNDFTNFDGDDHLTTLISQDPKVEYKNHTFNSYVKFQDKYLCLFNEVLSACFNDLQRAIHDHDNGSIMR